jgi:hypothetical protein
MQVLCTKYRYDDQAWLKEVNRTFVWNGNAKFIKTFS